MLSSFINFLIGIGISLLITILVIFFIKWESKKATSYYEKKKSKK